MDNFGDHYRAPNDAVFDTNCFASSHENTSSTTTADDELTYIMQPVSETPKLPFQNQRLVHHHHPSLVQDQAKLDKKRERNRIAASKCRQRKLEKIQTLEEQVFRLRRENEDLRNFSEQLNDNLEKIKSQLDFHLSQGCNLDSPKLDPLPSFSSTSSSKAGSLLPPDSTCLS